MQLSEAWLKTWKRLYSDGKCQLDGTWCQRNKCQSLYQKEITPEESGRWNEFPGLSHEYQQEIQDYKKDMQHIYWAGIAFILRRWQPRIEERPEAIELMLPQGSVPWLNCTWGKFEFGRDFTLRKPWQCGLSPASDENLRYLSPATSGLPAPRW